MTTATDNVLKHVMVDIETLGNGPNGMIVSVAACRFDPDMGEAGMISNPSGCFHAIAKPTGSRVVDGDMEFDTVRWWLKQKPEAQQRVFWPAEEPQHNIATIMFQFCRWLAEQGPFEFVWANPPGFDLRLMRAAFDRATANMPLVQTIGQLAAEAALAWPIGFRTERDYRTLRHVGKVLGIEEPLRVGVAHDALDDALHQAGYAIKVLRACAEAGLSTWIHVQDASRERGTLCNRPQLASTTRDGAELPVSCPYCLAATRERR